MTLLASPPTNPEETPPLSNRQQYPASEDKSLAPSSTYMLSKTCRISSYSTSKTEVPTPLSKFADRPL